MSWVCGSACAGMFVRVCREAEGADELHGVLRIALRGTLQSLTELILPPVHKRTCLSIKSYYYFKPFIHQL